jgi:hypothetical protein
MVELATFIAVAFAGVKRLIKSNELQFAGFEI